jgi:hypothetical protein
LQPAAVCLSAATPASAAALAEVYAAVIALPGPQPRLFFGGRAFNADPALRKEFPAAVVAATARELVAHLASA